MLKLALYLERTYVRCSNKQGKTQKSTANVDMHADMSVDE